MAQEPGAVRAQPMRYYPKRADRNQKAIAEALTRAGCTVTLLHTVGGGCPDLLVGGRGMTHLVEVKKVGPKGGMSSGAKRSLAGEERWASVWTGVPVLFVTGPENALEAVEAQRQALRGVGAMRTEIAPQRAAVEG